MKTRTLMVLAGVAVVVAGLALWLSQGREAATGRAAGEPLVPGLMDRLNEVESLQVQVSGSPPVTLERTAAGWVVAERGGYPVDLAKLRRQLIALAEARLLEEKTSRPEYYGRLGVEDPGEEGAASTRLSVRLPGEERVLILGNTDFRGQESTYVRRAGEASSWSASGNLVFDGNPVDWLARDVIDVPTAAVRRVVLEHPDGERVVVAKAGREDPNFALENLPADRELLSPSSPNAVATALGSLRLEEVQALDAFDAGGAEPVRASFETWTGERVEARAWQLGEERWVQLTVSEDPAADGAGGDAADDGGDDAPSSAPGVTVQAPDIERWVFRVPSYKYGNLTKRLEDLLKPLEEPGEAPAEASSEASSEG